MVKRGRGRPKKISPDNLTDRGKRMEKCEDIPEFFKIYVPAMCTDSMRIPPEFIKKIGGNIPRIARLTREPGLLSWQVSVSRNDEHWFLGEGWAEFVQENSVENCDFLTFSYVGNSTFSVKVFGPNGCRKSIEDRSSIKYGKSTENDLQGDDGTSESENSRNSGRNSSPELVAGKSVCRNPSFSVVMTKYYLRKGCLHVPSKFWKVHVGKDERRNMVTLCTQNKCWAVSFGTLYRVQFGKGWGNFVKDNSLQRGNLCIFQLIDRTDLAFKVTIIR